MPTCLVASVGHEWLSVAHVGRERMESCPPDDENDKTDPSDKLQHKMNLVSNYFIK
jgi:hypothetical protein